MTNEEAPASARRPSRRAPRPGSRAADAEAAGPAPTGPIVAANQAEPGPANARWRALLAEGGPILADGAMGTMLFASGPPVRRSARGLERQQPRGRPADPPRLPRRRLADRHDEHVRRQPPPAPAPRPRRAGRRAEPDGGDPRSGPRSTRPAARALVAGDIGPTGEIMAPARDARRGRGRRRLRRAGGGPRRGGVDVIWIETMSHLSEIGRRSAAPGRPRPRSRSSPR